MKFGSNTALALVLALGAATLTATPATAKKKDDAAQTKYNFTPAVQTALSDAQKAVAANDSATALAKLAAAKPEIKTDDDRYFYSSVLYDVSKLTKDPTQQHEAFLGMVNSPRTSDGNKAVMDLALYQDAVNANDWAGAETYIKQAITLNTTEPNAYALLADAQAKQKRPADALQTLQTAIAAKQAKGEVVPQEWLRRGMAIGYDGKLGPQTTELSYVWLKAYPSKTNWRDALAIFRDANKMEGDDLLDVTRLMFATNSMTGQGDYVEYAENTYTRLPNEAKTALAAGSTAGFVKLNQPGPGKELNDIVVKRIPADKASIGASATQAKGPKGTGRLALATADSYASYGDFTNAIAMYQLALSKSDVDKNVVNTRLAMAQAKSGQKDAAKQTLTLITGPRAALAKYIAIWLDQGAPTA